MRGNRTLKMLMILLIIVMIPLTVRASESNYKIVKSEVNYIIYIENYEDVEFLFAFSNDSTIDVNDLDFTENWTDTNESNIACLDDGFGIDFSQPVYMWVKDSAENYILSKVNLDFSNAINLDEISELNKLTERIKVDTTQKDIENTNQDGVETKKETGKLVITDSDKKDYTYEFEMYEILDGNDAFKLLKSLNNVNSMDDDISMYQKICMYEELFENYNTVINNANLDTVSNFEIKQPEDSKTGDKYLVVLSKKLNEEQKNIDIQVLECSAKENKVVTTESIPVKTTSMLPVTGEQIGIYIFLGIILLLIIFVVLRIYFLVKKKDESK